jgi:hypothetical protein
MEVVGVLLHMAEKTSKKTQKKEWQKQVEGEKEIRKGEREKGERRRAFVNNKIT